MNKGSWVSTILFLPKLGLKLLFWPFSYFFSSRVPEKNGDESIKNANDLKQSKELLEKSDISLEEKFEKSCEILKTFNNLSNEQQLLFYGLFKQAKEGDVKKEKPNIFDVVELKKWEAWKSRQGMKSDEAMTLYINMIKEIILSLGTEEEKQEEDIFMNEEEFQKMKSEKMGMGVKMSKIIQNEENIPEFKNENSQPQDFVDKFFDLVNQENIEEMKKNLDLGLFNLENRNSAGVTAFHFSIDNEKIQSFFCLLPYYAKFNINIQDATGMTPFHYALLIDNNQIIETLLKEKPDVHIKDENGETALNLASNAQKELINKYLS